MPITGRQIRFVLASIILSLVMAVVLAEIFMGVREKYARKSVLDYADTKRRQPLGWGGFLKENLTIYVTDGLGGKVRWTNNGQGFRSDQEFTRVPAPGVLRILALGDSFNVGFRVGQDQTLAHWRNEWIKKNYGQSEILVAETEEPTAALYYLEKFGLQLKPQIVLLGITLGNDIVEAYQSLEGREGRGHYVLTIENGKAHIEVGKSYMYGYKELAAHQIPSEYLKPETSTERIIRASERWMKTRYLLRRFFQEHEPIKSWGDGDHPSLFDFNNGFGVFTNPLPPVIEEAYQSLFRILEGFSVLCRQHGIIFAVQIFPQRYQVQPEDWARTVEEYGLKASRFNLMGPNQKIAAFCREHGIVCIDPTAVMAKQYEKTHIPLYLPRGDMHWNKAGHQAYFSCSLPDFTELVRKGFQKVQVSSQKLTKDRASRALY